MSDAPTLDPAEPADDYERGDKQEGLRLLSNGLVVAFIDGDRFLLRRPKAGEYRRMREDLEALQDDLSFVAYEAQEQNKALVASVDDNERPPLEAELEIRRRNRDIVREGNSKRAEWVYTAFSKLGDKPLTDDRDEWPVWFGTDETIVALITHWQRRPSLPGAR